MITIFRKPGKTVLPGLVLAAAQLSFAISGPAQAGLFDDDEARKRHPRHAGSAARPEQRAPTAQRHRGVADKQLGSTSSSRLQAAACST